VAIANATWPGVSCSKAIPIWEQKQNNNFKNACRRLNELIEAAVVLAQPSPRLRYEGF